jgi:DNA-directed RNA polymerase alpha subunit
MKHYPDIPLKLLPLTTRALNVLTAAGAKTAGDVHLMSLCTIGREPKCGKKTLKEIELMFFQEEK